MTSQAKTAAFTDSTNRATISHILELTFLIKFDEALAVVDTLEMQLGEHPAVPLLRAGVIYCRMMDYEDNLEEEEFERNYKIAMQLAEDLYDQGEIAEANLYEGVLLGFEAILKQREGKWWPAVKIGLKATGHLKDCLKEDSTYVDALLGIATYKYWSSKATDFINWLPLIPDQKEEGIMLMRKAMNEGLFSREISRSTLAWTLIDAGKLSEAIRLSLEGLEKYPNSNFFLWTLGSAYYKIGRLESAEYVYKKLFTEISNRSRNNHYNELGICRKLAYIYLALNEPEEALNWINLGLSRKLDDYVRDRREKTLKNLQELKKRAEVKIAEKQTQVKTSDEH